MLLITILGIIAVGYLRVWAVRLTACREGEWWYCHPCERATSSAEGFRRLAVAVAVVLFVLGCIASNA